MVLISVSGADQAPVDETVTTMSVGGLEQAPVVTQVAQMAQEEWRTQVMQVMQKTVTRRRRTERNGQERQTGNSDSSKRGRDNR